MKNDDDFLKELLSMFKVEAEEHLKVISSGLIDLEKASEKDRAGILEVIYREAHSLKGAARAVNLIKVEQLCQSLESIFALFKKGELDTSKEIFDVLLDAVDIVFDAVDSPETTDINDIRNRLERIENMNKQAVSDKSKEKADLDKKNRSGNKKKTPSVKKENSTIGEAHDVDTVKDKDKIDEQKARNAGRIETKPIISDTIRISTSKMDSILLQVEEMVSAKLGTEQVTTDLREVLVTMDIWRKEWEKVYSSFRQGSLSFLEKKEKKSSEVDAEFFNWNFHQLRDVDDKLNYIYKLAEINFRQLSVMIDNLLEDMKTILMLPFSTLLKMVPKVVRDIARDQDKDVELVMRGSTTEVDRRILEEIKDPLIHLLRNCIDHGIEKPNVRKKVGKPEQGIISISIAQIEGDKIEIMVEDDGAGIDPEKVKKTALERGIISEQEARNLNDMEAISLVFESDLSTSPIITDISGRGLGLAIVREKVEKLGGLIQLETEVGKRTRFRIVIPVTLATFRGTLIEVGGSSFVVPTVNVERAMRVPVKEIKTVENRRVINFRNQVISLVLLSDVLGLIRDPGNVSQSDTLQIVIIRSANKIVALGVDSVINEQEFLVKGLGKHIVRVKNIAGATILGSGKVVPILNVQDVIKSAEKVISSPIREVSMGKEQEAKKSILIAEDSITSRTLLKNILESAGYAVKATVDGADAFAALRSGRYDLVVSDVEMPRMNGFELVSNIRKNRATADTPVILVTGLESKEDRERGIEVGANAYIVKRSFDQSNLLDVISKLI